MAKFTRTHGDMTYSQAVAVLSRAKKLVLKDRAFGDSEITWVDDDGKVVADGYNGWDAHLTIGDTTFRDDTARSLFKYYVSVCASLN